MGTVHDRADHCRFKTKPSVHEPVQMHAANRYSSSRISLQMLTLHASTVCPPTIRGAAPQAFAALCGLPFSLAITA
jgi:hypothetical protein